MLLLEWHDAAFEYMEDASTSACLTGIDATYEVSQFHLLGVGTPKDPVKARHLLEKAAEKGHSSAQFELAMLRMEDEPVEAMKLVRAASKTHAVAMHYLSEHDASRALLETAGRMIPAALYDLALRHIYSAERMDTEENYAKAAELLERALGMPEPLFDCATLDRAEASHLLTRVNRRLEICKGLHGACMDTILRLAQFKNSPLLADIVEKAL
jgi:TPR repeat protein